MLNQISYTEDKPDGCFSREAGSLRGLSCILPDYAQLAENEPKHDGCVLSKGL